MATGRHNDPNLPRRLSAGRSPLSTEQVLPPTQESPRAHTDVITYVLRRLPTLPIPTHPHRTTLAQRLSELAAANSEGLLK